MNPYLVTTENPQDLPILIVDKRGVIGEALALKLAPEFLTIFVNGHQKAAGNNIIKVPYRHKIPNIPDNLFSYIFVISEDESEAYSHVKTLVKKAKENNAHIVVILPSTQMHDKFMLKLQYLYPEVMIVIYGDLFGASEQMSVVDEFLEQVGKQGSITISRSGLEKSYPMLFSDAISGIIRAVFSQFHQGEIFLLLPNFFVSDISLTRMIQKEMSELTVEVVRKNRKQQTYCIPKRGIYIYPTYDIEEKIKDAVKSFSGLKRIAQRIHAYAPSKLARLIRYTKTGVLVTTVLVLLFLFLGGLSYIGITQLLTQHDKKASSQSSTLLTRSDFVLRVGQQVLADVTPLASLVGLTQPVEIAQDYLSTALVLSQLEKRVTSVTSNLASMSMKEMSGEELEKLRVDMKYVITTYASLVASNQSRNALSDDLASDLEVLTTLSSFVDILPELQGIASKKNYLVLFVDNTELRGSGGVVETYGLLTINKGKSEKFVVLDTNELDITMKETIAPPSFLKKSLGREQLFLKDSLFSPDFPTGGEQANLLYYLMTQQRIDGIISVDMVFLQELLRMTKGASITGLKHSLTADTFIKDLQSTIADKTLPTSPEKKEQVAKIYTAMQKTLETQFATDPLRTIQFLRRMSASRHIQLYSEEPSIENVFLFADLSATTKERRVRRAGKYADFSMVSEANVEENNANYYLKRTLEQKVTISQQGNAESMLSIKYQNTSGAQDTFGGDYTSYVQVAVPKGATLSEITIDGEVHAIRTPGSPAPVARRNAKVAASIEVQRSEEGERVLFGFYLTVPKAQTKTVTITYLLPKVVVMDNGKFVYSYLFAKQPGSSDEDSLRVGIDFPQTLHVESLSSGATEEDGQILYADKLTKDQLIEAVFSQK